MARGRGIRWDAFAVEDAFALRAQLAIAGVQPSLDPRMRPFLDRVRRTLRRVGDETALDAALEELRPVFDALALWPVPRDAPPPGGDAERRAPVRSERRVLRFSAAFSALWALCHGPDDEAGRRFARTAVELSRRGGLGTPPRPPARFTRDLSIINGVSFVRHVPVPPPDAAAAGTHEETAPDALDALAPARQRRARALARPAARRIERVLRQASGALTAQEIADLLGRHHTGVRAQLGALERSGVVEVRVDPPDGRGRPARRYALAPDPGDREAAGHRELVRLLMSLVREAGFGPAEIERFGERQGASIVQPGAGAGELREAFERLGFAPRPVEGGAPGDLVLGRCPFADGVEAPHGQLICLLHLGLARGIAREAAPGTEVVDLEVKEPRRAGCRLRLSGAPG
jgi:predicted ArsR family transcriptional regulator